MRMGRIKESEYTFKIILKKNKEFKPALVNLAILYDTIENHELAIKYYKKALKIDDSLVKGMGFLERFFKNIHFKPSTIKERLDYLEKQILLKNGEKNLVNKKIDQRQPDFQR